MEERSRDEEEQDELTLRTEPLKDLVPDEEDAEELKGGKAPPSVPW